MTLREALDRTLLLMRDDLRADAPDGTLLDALESTEVVLVADRYNLASSDGQTALVAAAILCARSGARCYLEIPNVPRVGAQPPLRGDDLAPGLFDLGADLLPGAALHDGRPAHAVDVAVVIGDSPWRGRAAQTWCLSGNAWTGAIAPHGTRWRATGSPFGALASAGLAGGEAFKIALRRLRGWAANASSFDEHFTPTTTAQLPLAPAGTPVPTPRVERFDLVGGGAITHAALFALARVPALSATARVIEPGVADAPDLNRYALLRRSVIGVPKVASLGAIDLGGVQVEGVPDRFDDETARNICPLAPDVLVGVDDIPSRWAVQRARPTWLGVGATTHYSALISFHAPGLPCAICLHPRADNAVGPAPTVAFVSFWAGLWLASRFIRHAAGEVLPAEDQQLYTTMLRPDGPGAVWRSPVYPRPECPLRCPL
jgi:hypothetical protein